MFSRTEFLAFRVYLLTRDPVDEKSDIWKLPDLIEKILISGIPSDGVQAKRAKAMLNHLKPIMRECKIKVQFVTTIVN